MGHYYTKTSNGVEPRHFVGVSSRPGELRPTTLRDAKKFGWVPSVTTIQNLLDKPALTNWKIDEHLKQAYKLKDVKSFGEENWIEVVKTGTQEALDKAPKDGTDFHDSIENYLNGNPVPKEHEQACMATKISLHTYTGGRDWITEQSFVHSMGFAGKVDVHTSGWVCDFKTKNTADKWKPGKMAYPEMAMQLAAYRIGLGLDNARCANVFICLEDGAVEFHEWPEEELSKQWANFADLLRIWLRNAGYVPGSVKTDINS